MIHLGGCYYWGLVGGGQGCCYTSYNEQDRKNDMVLNVNCVAAEKTLIQNLINKNEDPMDHSCSWVRYLNRDSFLQVVSSFLTKKWIMPIFGLLCLQLA